MIAMMKPFESRMCVVPMCFANRANGLRCRKHEIYQKIGSFLMGVATVIALAISVAALLSMAGCAETGPSKERLRELLSQCREANRERVRIIKEYDSTPMFDFSKCAKIDGVDGWVCPTVSEVSRPGQNFGVINFSEAGN